MYRLEGSVLCESVTRITPLAKSFTLIIAISSKSLAHPSIGHVDGATDKTNLGHGPDGGLVS